MRALLDDADSVISCRLLYVEAAAALAQARRGDRLTTRVYTTALHRLEDLWKRSTSLRSTNHVLRRRAAVLAARPGLRGCDAVHCAGAEQLGGPDLVAAAGDGRLLYAWRMLGLSTFDPRR